ncbi:hypothetical protein HRbin06_00887 [archaeon HR06]|nr:hypothetical protein HRbin06_00887 [archaeon HR06]
MFRVIFLIALLIPFSYSSTGNLIVKVYNLDGKVAPQNTKVLLYDDKGNFLEDSFVDSEGKVTFYNKPSGYYTIEVYQYSSLTIFWGSERVFIPSGSTNTFSFTRKEPYLLDISLSSSSIALGEFVEISITLRNPIKEGKEVYVKWVMDRDKNLPYDFELTSGTVNLKDQFTYKFLFKPLDIGLYYLLVILYSGKVTDVSEWVKTLKVEVKPLKIDVKTDKVTYELGNDLKVLGKVDPVKENNYIFIQLLDPDNKTISSSKILPNFNGEFSLTLLNFNRDMKEGKYTIIARYVDVSSNYKFNYFYRLEGKEVFLKPENFELKENTIYVKYKNRSSFSREVIIYLQIKDLKGTVVSIAGIKKEVEGRKEVDFYLNLNLKAGEYKAESFLWEANTLSPLAEKGELIFVIK